MRNSKSLNDIASLDMLESISESRDSGINNLAGNFFSQFSNSSYESVYESDDERDVESVYEADVESGYDSDIEEDSKSFVSVNSSAPSIASSSGADDVAKFALGDIQNPQTQEALMQARLEDLSKNLNMRAIPQGFGMLLKDFKQDFNRLTKASLNNMRENVKEGRKDFIADIRQFGKEQSQNIKNLQSDAERFKSDTKKFGDNFVKEHSENIKVLEERVQEFNANMRQNMSEKIKKLEEKLTDMLNKDSVKEWGENKAEIINKIIKDIKVRFEAFMEKASEQLKSFVDKVKSGHRAENSESKSTFYGDELDKPTHKIESQMNLGNSSENRFTFDGDQLDNKESLKTEAPTHKIESKSTFYGHDLDNATTLIEKQSIGFAQKTAVNIARSILPDQFTIIEKIALEAIAQANAQQRVDGLKSQATQVITNALSDNEANSLLQSGEFSRRSSVSSDRGR